MDAPTSLARTRAYVRHVGSSRAAMLSVLSQLRASLRKRQSMVAPVKDYWITDYQSSLGRITGLQLGLKLDYWITA